VTRDSLDPALRARAEAARALLREDPAVDRLSVLAAVVAPRDPILERVQPQGRGWRRTLGREAVLELFRLRDEGVSFGTIATQFHVHKSTLVAISQKAARDGRAAVLERYTPAANGNSDRIAEDELALLITAALERRLRRWAAVSAAGEKAERVAKTADTERAASTPNPDPACHLPARARVHTREHDHLPQRKAHVSDLSARLVVGSLSPTARRCSEAERKRQRLRGRAATERRALPRFPARPRGYA
jgi:hypothetical protein